MIPPTVQWQCRGFAALGVDDLAAIYQARQQVFVVEQACAYLDADGLDADCLHLTACEPGERLPLAYARLLPPGLRYAEASIGRVLTRGRGRGCGIGRALVRRALVHVASAHPGHAVRIGAQAHLQAFYGGFGFVADSEPYLEDGIAHVEMLLVRP